MTRDRAAIYARFSSHNQRSESIEIQLDKAHAYCKENGLKVVREYCDYAQTGRDMDRDNFQTMIADSRRGLFDFVVISKVTRIMRNRDEMALARVMLRRSGVDILYADEQIPDGSAGVLQLGLLEVLAEYESALDSERIRDGIKKNAMRCMANGQLLFGFDIVDGKYELNDREADIIRRAYRMLFDGASLSEIARAFDGFRTRRGKPFTPKAVDRILRRRKNAGEYSYAGVVVPGGMPAIVPMKWVEDAVKILDSKVRPKKRLGYEDFRLTGKLYDGRDGYPMIGTSGTSHLGRVYYYYRCKKCRRTVRRDLIEADVADAVRTALKSQGNREKIARLMTDFEKERAGDAPQSARIEDELRGIEAAYDNIWKAIEAGIAPPGGKERIDDLKARQEVLEEELKVARSLERVRLDEERVLFWLESMAERLDDDTILRLFVSRVTLQDDGGFDILFTFDETGGGDGGEVRADSPMLHHRIESDRLRLVAFFVAGARVRTRRGAERRSGRLRSRLNPRRPTQRKENEMKTDRYGISGSTLKIIAAISMVLDHVSRIVLTNGIMTHASYNQISDEQWAILSEASDVLHVLGRIAFPLFCFLIVEGFLHTHDIKKYLRNMLVFAIIAEPIYDFVQTGQLFDLRQQNVMCELLLSLVFLIILEKIQSLSKWKRHIAEFALIVLIALAAEYTKLDGGVYGILLVAAFYLFHDSKAKMLFAAVCAVLLSSCHIVGGGFEFATANVFNPDVAAAVVSLLLINLYNGKRGLKLKYFFYIFYPAHLALLYGVSLIVLNCL